MMFERGGPTLLELAEQALSSTQRGYDLLAPKFDHTPFRTPDAILEAVLADVTGPLRAGLDLCCGTGAALPYLMDRCERVVGVDFSPGMLDIARRRCAGRAGGTVELVEHDILEPSTRAGFDEPEAFDVVTCFGAFGHIRPDQEAAFVDLVYRSLRPGGRFVFASAEMPPRWSLAFVVSKTFNAAMHLRNAVLSPPFVMYYLTFMLPDCVTLLERRGFSVERRSAGLPPPMGRLEVVTASRSLS